MIVKVRQYQEDWCFELHFHKPFSSACHCGGASSSTCGGGDASKLPPTSSFSRSNIAKAATSVISTSLFDSRKKSVVESDPSLWKAKIIDLLILNLDAKTITCSFVDESILEWPMRERCVIKLTYILRQQIAVLETQTKHAPGDATSLGACGSRDAINGITKLSRPKSQLFELLSWMIGGSSASSSSSSSTDKENTSLPGSLLSNEILNYSEPFSSLPPKETLEGRKKSDNESNLEQTLKPSPSEKTLLNPDLSLNEGDSKPCCGLLAEDALGSRRPLPSHVPRTISGDFKSQVLDLFRIYVLDLYISDKLPETFAIWQAKSNAVKHLNTQARMDAYVNVQKSIHPLLMEGLKSLRKQIISSIYAEPSPPPAPPHDSTTEKCMEEGESHECMLHKREILFKYWDDMLQFPSFESIESNGGDYGHAWWSLERFQMILERSLACTTPPSLSQILSLNTAALKNLEQAVHSDISRLNGPCPRKDSGAETGPTAYTRAEPSMPNADSGIDLHLALDCSERALANQATLYNQFLRDLREHVKRSASIRRASPTSPMRFSSVLSSFFCSGSAPAAPVKLSDLRNPDTGLVDIYLALCALTMKLEKEINAVELKLERNLLEQKKFVSEICRLEKELVVRADREQELVNQKRKRVSGTATVPESLKSDDSGPMKKEPPLIMTEKPLPALKASDTESLGVVCCSLSVAATDKDAQSIDTHLSDSLKEISISKSPVHMGESITVPDKPLTKSPSLAPESQPVPIPSVGRLSSVLCAKKSPSDRMEIFNSLVASHRKLKLRDTIRKMPSFGSSSNRRYSSPLPTWDKLELNHEQEAIFSQDDLDLEMELLRKSEEQEELLKTSSNGTRTRTPAFRTFRHRIWSSKKATAPSSDDASLMLASSL